MLAARLANETIEIGPAHASKSYLNASAIINAAKAVGADAVHPGYGFLAENAGFAAAVEESGLTFIGPKAETIRCMGDKATARSMAAAIGLPTVPGSGGRILDSANAMTIASEIGFPLMIKAAAGGGGRGIRIAATMEELEGALQLASAEAQAAFGDGGLYLERFISAARHIEVQILGDGANVVHVYERECSLQRRRQKVWEEAPAACLSSAARESLCASAVRLARHVNYRGAGTLEYLYDEITGKSFFIEMNTRIQVEHPVSEMITGIDLVAEMICIASGAKLSISQQDVEINGHAIECRINAEDPEAGFRPCPGVVEHAFVPCGQHIRFDSGIYPGYVIPPFYDSLLGKLIVWGPTRKEALARMHDALSQVRVRGIKTTVPLHLALARDPEVAAGKTHTSWLEEWLANRRADTAFTEASS